MGIISPRFTTIRHTATVLGLKDNTIRSWVERRRIASHKFGGRRMISFDEIERLIREGECPAVNTGRPRKRLNAIDAIVCCVLLSSVGLPAGATDLARGGHTVYYADSPVKGPFPAGATVTICSALDSVTRDCTSTAVVWSDLAHTAVISQPAALVGTSGSFTFYGDPKASFAYAIHTSAGALFVSNGIADRPQTVSVDDPRLTGLRTTSTVTLAASTTAPGSSTPVTFTATVAPVNANNGLVSFLDAATPLGTAPVSSGANPGTASFQTTLGSGSHTITTNYPGDFTYSASSSNSIAVTVSSGSGPATLSQSAWNGGSGATTLSSVPAGAAVFAMVQNSGGVYGTVTDDLGHSFTVVKQQNLGDSGATTMALYVYANETAGSRTVTASASSGTPSLEVVSVANALTTGTIYEGLAFNATANSVSGGAMSCPALTSTATNELGLAFPYDVNPSSPGTFGGGFSAVHAPVQYEYMIAGYANLATAGSVTPTYTQNAANQPTGCIALAVKHQ